MFTKILVPLDGSELAERALSPATTLATPHSGKVILLSVTYLQHMFVEEPEGYGFLLPEDSLAQTRRELTAYLENLRRTRARPELNLLPRVLEGDVASCIVDTAASEDVDLIVMSTHGRSGFSRWMLGSVTERVLRQAPCPVLVIRETKPFQHVLITLDGSELSEQALGPGLEVARRFGSRVTLFQVEPSEELAPQFVAELESVEGSLSEKARDDFYLETYLQRVSRQFQPTMDQEIEFASATGPVAPAILDFIESHDVDLVAMTTHGRSGLKRWVYGSVTEKVLHVADCGLLVVRPPAERLD